MVKYLMSLACALTLVLLASCGGDCCPRKDAISKTTEQSQPADANNILGVKVEEEKTEKF